MIWTNQNPDKAGWYWKFAKTYGGVEIVSVMWGGSEWWSDGVKIQDGFLWSGPIPMPEGELPKPTDRM